MSLLRKRVIMFSRSMPGGSSPPEFILALRKLSSDARSGQVVDERIRPALESGYAVGSSKPVLVVIDEIDGATGDNVCPEFIIPDIVHGVISRLTDSLTNSYNSPTRNLTNRVARKRRLKARKSFDAQLSVYATIYMRHHWPSCDLWHA
jgi:hypothetical protein